MTEHFLLDHPQLRPFVLSNVHHIGTMIGGGAYGKVEEVVMGAAAKTLYVLLPTPEAQEEQRKAEKRFVEECRLMSTLNHQNIVQFLGVAFFPNSRLPALVMERLITNLHDLLAPVPPRTSKPLSFFSLALRCSVLHNVASGLEYLHYKTPQPIIHRDLSAKNILLDSDLVAKIADLGVARILADATRAAVMTKAPGNTLYMPPEASDNVDLESSLENVEEEVTYNASIDVFSFGVVTIFAIGQTFPCNLLAPNYVDKETGLLHARTELERRSKYMDNVNEQLRANGQVRGDHPLIQLIQLCLHNLPTKRPGIREVLRLLDEARAGVRDEESGKYKCELVQALQAQHMNQNYERVLRDLVKQNAELKSRVHTKDKELSEVQQQLRQKEEELQSNVGSSHLQRYSAHMKPMPSYRQNGDRHKTPPVAKPRKFTCRVHGPGLTSATVNSPTQIVVELTDTLSKSQVSVTAQLEFGGKSSKLILDVFPNSHSRYDISYTAEYRGHHKLHVQVNDREINGSPFTVTVYRHPKDLHYPVTRLTDVRRPYGVASNIHDELIVSECFDNKLSIYDITKKKIRMFGSNDDSQDQMNSPVGIANDNAGNIYVSSWHKLQKFTRYGELKKCVGQRGDKVGEFDDPLAVTLYGNELYVCDSKNHRIQVFDLDLNATRCIGSQGKEIGELDTPFDVQFDIDGNMYVAEWRNGRVQVLNCRGYYIRMFGLNGSGKLINPSGLHIADKYVYVSDSGLGCVIVYNTSGEFVTSLERNLDQPRCITSCTDGLIHICDFGHDAVVIY